MGKSMDFSEGIKIIREAHEDASAILAKWRDLIAAPGELTLTVKNPDGTTSDIILPTIREAINRYLGGIFEQITLTDGSSTVVVRLNESGEVELVQGDGSPANLIAGNIEASRIVGPAGGLPIAGNVRFLEGSIENATIQSLRATAGNISKATFTGTTILSGSSRIEGSLTVKKIDAESISIGQIQYRKQIISFEVEGVRSDSLKSPTNGDIWTGDVSILEAAGIYAEPTWCDCTNTPESITGTENKIHIYWDTPDIGDIPIAGLDGGYDFDASYMAAWPYKMYEPVDGGYRIRWLPLNDQVGRIHYARTGNAAKAVAADHIEVISTATGIDVQIVSETPVSNYSCRRFMADYMEEQQSLSATSHHILYKA